MIRYFEEGLRVYAKMGLKAFDIGQGTNRSTQFANMFHTNRNKSAMEIEIIKVERMFISVPNILRRAKG